MFTNNFVFKYCSNINNNNKLQLGYHPVAVVILHVHKYGKKLTRKFKSGGLHERHVNNTNRKFIMKKNLINKLLY